MRQMLMITRDISFLEPSSKVLNGFVLEKTRKIRLVSVSSVIPAFQYIVLGVNWDLIRFL